eukprot:GILJ01007928.1.p1 GENE.GILJ01007928.1~~GILJ01007928.1.p1  ORF type:complete len:600 (-),score=61.12 GILJ01007928.1:121-1668(-)
MTVAVDLVVPHHPVGGVLYVTAVHPISACFREGVALFLIQASAGTGAIRRTFFFGMLWGLTQMLLGIGYLTSILNATDVADGTSYMWIPSDYWFYYDISVVAFYALILCLSFIWRSSRLRHNAIRTYCLFLISSVTAFLVIHYISLQNYPIGSCFRIGNSIMYNLWPFAAFYALRFDSTYWRRIGKGELVTTRKVSWLFPSLQIDSLTEHLLPASAAIVDFCDLSILHPVGRGGTANVFAGTLLQRCEDSEETQLRRVDVAVKQFSCTTLTPEMVVKYMREIDILSRLRHPNVIMLYGVCVTPPTVSLVMEYASQGSLFDQLILFQHELSSLKRHRYLMDATRGLAFLHTHHPPVVHGDIKSLNLLIDEHGTLKVADFGESRFMREADKVSEDSGFYRHTPNWTAPEVFGVKPTLESDVYSLGMVIYEIFTGKQPFGDVSERHTIPGLILQGKRPTLPLSLAAPMKELVVRCWSQDPLERPTADELLRAVSAMQFIQQYLHSDKKHIQSVYAGLN